VKRASPNLDAALVELLNHEGWQRVEMSIRRQMRLKPGIRLKEKKLLLWLEIYGSEVFDPEKPAMTAADTQDCLRLQGDKEKRRVHSQFHME